MRGKIKKTFSICMILGFFFGFVFSTSGFAYEYIMNTNATSIWGWDNTQITTLNGGDWDNGYYDLALPADNQFYFYGNKVTHVRIWTNGYVTFGFGSAPTDFYDQSNDPIPWSNNPNAYAAPWWDDWDLSIGGEIWYVLYTGGPGGQNWLTITWKNVAHKYDPTSSYTFQVILFANYSIQPHVMNEILFNYQDTDSGTGTYDYGVSGTIGIEHYTGYQCEAYSYNAASVSNSQSIMFTQFMPIYGHTDYDSSGYPELCIFRPSNGKWFWYRNPNTGVGTDSRVWGTNGDVAVPGSYVSAGSAIDTVFRPSTSKWLSFDGLNVSWGTEGDIPVPADYNGDNITDPAVFRPSNGKWFVSLSGGGTRIQQWGTAGDIPVPGDYDGDGSADFAVFRLSNGKWYVSYSGGGTYVTQYGTAGDIPVPANFWSSSHLDPCVFRPSNGKWYTKSQLSGSTYIYNWGTNGDFPVPLDYNSGGLSDFAVFRASTGRWIISLGATGITWGTLGDKARSRRSHGTVLPQTGKWR